MNTLNTLAHQNTQLIDDKIKAILSKGHVVCFKNKISGTQKIVTQWNPDELGDLTAQLSTGSSLFVCPYALEYEIIELDQIPPDFPANNLS